MSETVTFYIVSERYFGLGIALACTIAIAGALLQYVRRFKGINTYLRSQFTFLKEKNVLSIILAILYYIILLTPVIVMLVWIILLGIDFGVTPCIPVLLYSLFIFALFVPTRSIFFYYKILVLFILFVAAQIVTMSLAWDKTKSSTFFCLTAVLLIINGIFTSVALWLMDGSCWSLPQALTAQLKKEVMKHFQIWKQQNDPPNIISGGLYFQICTRKITRIIVIVVMYVLAFLTLTTYTLVVFFHTDLGPLGLINSVCVLSTDIIIFMLIQITKKTQTSPFFNSTSGSMVRICLIAFAGNYWFVGYCLLYILLMFYITLLMVNKHYPTFEKIPSVTVQKINIFKMPEVPALILTSMFGGLIYYMGTDTGQAAIPVRQVQLQSTIYPFWTLGIASILLSFAVFFYILTLRIVQRSQQKIRSITKYYLGFQFLSEYYTFLLISYAALVILGIYMSVQVGNALIWVSCVFLPIFYQSFVIFYANWTENDFLLFGDVVAYNKKLKKRIQRQKMIEHRKTSVIKQMQKQGGMEMKEETKLNLMQGAQVQSNMMVGKDQRSQYQDWRDQTNIINALKENLMLPTDKSIIFSIPMMVLSLAAYCIAYWFIQYDHTAFNIAAELVFLFLTLIPMRRYFSTLEFPHFSHIILFICGIIVNYAYGVLSLVLQWNTSEVWTLFWSIINIFILSCYATFALLRDKGISIPTIVVTVVNVLLAFGIGIITLAAWMKIAEGIVLLGVAFYYAYTLFIIYVYLYRNKSLPWILIPISIGIVVCTCFAVMIYAFVEPAFDNFYGFSITYLAINLIILLYASQSLYRDLIDRYDRPNFFSPYIHPIFKYDPQIKSVKNNSSLIMFWLAGWLMFYSYTILMQIFIVDVNIGISTSQIFLLVAFLTIMYFSTYNTYKAGKQTKSITPEILETSWEQLLKMKQELGVISPSIDDIQNKLQKYRGIDEKGILKVKPVDQKKQQAEQSMNKIGQIKKAEKQPQQDIDLTIYDLENKLQKAIEDQKIELINYWITITFKVGVIKKKKMLRFTTFIRQSGDFLATIGVNIVLDNQLYDLQLVYQSALLQYNALSPLQRIKFDKQFNQWKLRKQDTEKKNQQLNQKHLESQKKREEELKKKIDFEEIDDSDQPIEKMRDSPLKLKKIRETMQGSFSDTHFRASNDIIPTNVRGDVKGWKRPNPEAVILRDGQSSMNVRQGYIGDCYLISAIGVLGREHLQKILGLGQWENPNGAYMVKFRKYNKNIHIIIDSEFPVDSANNWLFGRSEDANQMFCNILQKAYAKLYGGYQNVVGGKVSIALADMTGGFPQEIRLKDYQDQNTNQIFNKMVQFKKAGYLMGAGSPENAQGDAVDIDGIVQGHAYLVLDVRDLDGNKLIKVRNPHGNQGLQSTLDWSDDSPKWNKRLLNLLGQQLKQDGAFWLSLDDFVYVFRALYVTRIFNPQIWKAVGPLNGQWKGKNAAGLPTKKNPEAKIGNNPQYGVKVSKKSTLFVELSQNQLDASRRGKNYIFFMVQKTDGRRIHTFSMNKLLGKSGSPINSTSVSAEIVLQAPNYPYIFTLMACCIEQGAEGTFNLNFYCDDKNMEVIPNETFDI